MTSMQQSINPILEKKTSIIGTITGGRIRKRSGLLGLFSNSKVRLFLGCSKALPYLFFIMIYLLLYFRY